MALPRCDRCQGVIGVYEPMVVILCDGGEQSGSYLTLGPALTDPESRAFHERCHRQTAFLGGVGVLFAEG
jgi:hypothetical protein